MVLKAHKTGNFFTPSGTKSLDLFVFCPELNETFFEDGAKSAPYPRDF